MGRCIELVWPALVKVGLDVNGRHHEARTKTPRDDCRLEKIHGRVRCWWTDSEAVIQGVVRC